MHEPWRTRGRPKARAGNYFCGRRPRDSRATPGRGACHRATYRGPQGIARTRKRSKAKRQTEKAGGGVKAVPGTWCGSSVETEQLGLNKILASQAETQKPCPRSSFQNREQGFRNCLKSRPSNSGYFAGAALVSFGVER